MPGRKSTGAWRSVTTMPPLRPLSCSACRPPASASTSTRPDPPRPPEGKTPVQERKMQVTASNFFANHSSKSASREEVLAGDGLFDALLRKEAARHSREIQPRHQQREAARPANDDRRPHADKRPTVADRSREPARKEASARPEASKEHLTA